MIGLGGVGQLAVGDKGFPRRAGVRAQFVEEGLPGAFLEEQFVDCRVGGARVEFAVERHQAGVSLARLAAIGLRQRFDGLLERLGHAGCLEGFFSLAAKVVV